ncbi:MAG: hypothetical protein KAG64_02480 [Bacteroidales bacterium]|nr:hypothetical protein [Bacteroidales bacterium]
MRIISVLALGLFLLMSCSNNNNQPKVIDKEKGELISEVLIDTLFDFSNYQIASLPADWTESFTGKGNGTEWKIKDEQGNKVMAQLSNDNPNYHFNVVVFEGLDLLNMELNIRLKAVSGVEDQGGGFVWRFIDKDNYYVVRANPLEDNVVLYKVENGVRTDLPLLGKGKTYGVDVKPLGLGWNNLKLIVQDDVFTVYLNDEILFDVMDQTFIKKGKVGLWTKADAVTDFDDFHVQELSFQ